MKARTVIACLATVGWLALVAWWTFYRPGTAWSVPALDLNEWGDWAAGAFAPLAFGWLIVGYIQQGEELRDNVRALHLQEKALQLQVQELKDSVEQQAVLAKASTRQAELLEKSHSISLRAQVLVHQPRFGRFKVIESDQATGRTALDIWNDATACHDVQVFMRTPPPKDLVEEFPTVIGTWGTKISQTLAFNLSSEDRRFIELEFTYHDELLTAQVQRYRFELPAWGQSGHERHATLDGMTFNLPAAIST